MLTPANPRASPAHSPAPATAPLEAACQPPLCCLVGGSRLLVPLQPRKWPKPLRPLRVALLVKEGRIRCVSLTLGVPSTWQLCPGPRVGLPRGVRSSQGMPTMAVVLHAQPSCRACVCTCACACADSLMDYTSQMPTALGSSGQPSSLGQEGREPGAQGGLRLGDTDVSGLLWLP